jgi:hypothetical protein
LPKEIYTQGSQAQGLFQGEDLHTNDLGDEGIGNEKSGQDEEQTSGFMADDSSDH